MKNENNTGLGLIKTTIERVQNEKSLFNSALKKLTNSSEEELQYFLEMKLKNKILRRLYSDERLTIEALDGKATIANSKNIFKSYLDSDFENWKLNNKGKATEETPIQVYEMAKKANYSQMFNSLSSDLDSLCLTQSQIIRFCEKYPSHLRQEGNAYLFLFKENGEYFVARVFVSSAGLRVRVFRFEIDSVWIAESRPRLVVPQLKLAA